MEKDIKKLLDECSEIFLWNYIEGVGGFIWRMNHDLGDGRIESTPGIEKDLLTMGENIKYAVNQLVRFGVEDPQGKENEEGRKTYWEWYRGWKEHIDNLSDDQFEKMGVLLGKDSKDPCLDFIPAINPLNTDKSQDRFDILDL